MSTALRTGPDTIRINMMPVEVLTAEGIRALHIACRQVNLWDEEVGQVVEVTTEDGISYTLIKNSCSRFGYQNHGDEYQSCNGIFVISSDNSVSGFCSMKQVLTVGEKFFFHDEDYDEQATAPVVTIVLVWHNVG